MNVISNHRCIRVFISSTFVDMKQERDILVSTVFPKLRRKAAERNVSLIDVDLRWGVTESESKERKVIDICIDEIERSHPFFVGLLGDRYGWAPAESSDSDWSTVVSDKNKWVADLIRQGKSITEIEIMHGVLNAENQVHGCFFVKSCDEEGIDPRQKKLRTTVAEQTKLPVYTYAEPSELCDILERDFENLLDELYPIDDCDNFGIQVEIQNNFICSLTEYYTPVPAVTELYEKCKSKNGHVLLKGRTGMGKSTCMAQIVKELMVRDDCDVIAYFAGSNIHNTTFESAIDWISKSLSRLYGVDIPDVGIMDRLKTMVPKISFTKPLFIFLDGVNQYQYQVKDVGNFTWWPDWPSDVVCTFSSTDSDPIIKELAPMCTHVVTVRQMLIDQRLKLIERYMSPYRKSLNDHQYSLLLADTPLINNTHMFATLLDEVRRYGSYDSLDCFIQGLVSCEDALHFYDMLFDNQQDMFNNADELADVLSLIALSERGLPESDLLSISRLSRLALSRILISNQKSLSIRSGRVMISHQIFLDAVTERYLKDEDFVQNQREKIVMHYADDEAGNGKTAESVSEMCYQYYMLGYYDELYELMAEPWVFEKFADSGHTFTYARYWNQLLLEDPYRYDPRAIVNGALLNLVGSGDDVLGLVREPMLSLYIPGWLKVIDTFLVDMQQPRYAEDILRLVIKLINGIQSDDMDEYRRRAFNYLALCKRHVEDWNGALKVYLEMLECYQVESQDPIIQNIGEVLLSIYEATKKTEYLQKAEAVLDSVLQARVENCLPSQWQEVAVAYANYASALHHTDPDKAALMHEKALEMYRSKMGYNSFDVAVEYNNMALELVGLDPEKSLEYAEEALAIFENIDKDSIYSLQAHHVVAAILCELGNNERAVKELKYVLENKAYLIADPDEVYDARNRLMTCQYALKDYEGAVATGMEQVRNMSQDDPRLITILGNIGKFYISMTNLDKSVEYYRKAISLAFDLGLHEKELSAYIYLSQAYLGANALDDVLETLDTLYDKACGYGLSVSRYTAFALFNKGILIAHSYNEVENGINHINEAIEIREQTDDERTESDLCEYRRSLENLMSYEGSSEECNDDAFEMKNSQTKEFAECLSEIVDRDVAETLSNEFSISYDNFQNGNLEAAKHHFERCIALANDLDHQIFSAKSMICRYYAYTMERIHVNTVFERESREDIMYYYAMALDFARADDNNQLASKVLHDIAEFYWAIDDYNNAENYYWQELSENISNDVYVDLRNIKACVNIISAMQRQASEVDPMLTLHICSLAMTLLRQDRGLFEDNSQLVNMLGCAMTDSLEVMNIDPESYEIEYARSLLFIADYIVSTDFTQRNRIAECLYSFAMAYYIRTDDEENTVLCKYNCALASYRDALYGRAIFFIGNVMDRIKASLDEGLFMSSLDILGRCFVRVHNISSLHDLCVTYDYPMENFEDEIRKTTPVLSLLRDGCDSELQNLVDHMRNVDMSELEESQLYDLTLYYIETGNPHEAGRYFKAWENVIMDHDDFSLFEPEYKSLAETLHNSTKLN